MKLKDLLIWSILRLYINFKLVNFYSFTTFEPILKTMELKGEKSNKNYFTQLMCIMKYSSIRWMAVRVFWFCISLFESKTT